MEYDSDRGDRMIPALLYLTSSQDKYSAAKAHQRGAHVQEHQDFVQLRAAGDR